jgi:putative transposase
MVIGSDLDGRKDVPEMWIGEHETAKFRLVVLNELRNRGVQDILICCVDNLRGFSEVIAACFPEAQVQKCVVHQIRNSVRYVSYKDVKKVLPDLEPIYTAATEPPALEVLDGFAAMWGGKYSSIVNSWRAN